jgi:hypothetical protein
MITATVVALVVGLASPAVSQSGNPTDPMGANYWTGTWTRTDAEPGVTTEHTGYTESLGEVVHGVVEADDPRMAGAWTQINNIRFAPSREPGEGDVGIVNGTARIDNDAGAWVGTFTLFGSQSGGQEWYVMEGEGAYEGLSTVFRFDEDGFAGVIMAADLPPLPDPVAAPAEAASAAPGEVVDGLFDIGEGRTLYLRCAGEGSPLILLEAGDERGVDKWFQVFDALASQTRTCAYDRAGIGRSSEAVGCRGLDDILDDLDALIGAAGLAGPFLPVAHSGGGFLMAGWAARHPGEVAGLVLLETPKGVDVSTLPPDVVEGIACDSPTNIERRDYAGIEQAAWDARAQLGVFPMTIVSNDPGPGAPAWEQTNVADQRGWLVLSPSSKQVIVTSGHDVVQNEPELVEAEILAVLAAARRTSPPS